MVQNNRQVEGIIMVFYFKGIFFMWYVVAKLKYVVSCKKHKFLIQ